MNAPNDYKPSFRGLAPEHSGWRHLRVFRVVMRAFPRMRCECSHMCAFSRMGCECVHFRAWDANARIWAHAMRMLPHAHISPHAMRCKCAHVMRCECAHQGGTYACPVLYLWSCDNKCISNKLPLLKRNFAPGLMNMMYLARGGVGGVLQKNWQGCSARVLCNHTLGYGDRGPKSYPWLRKMGQNQTLDNGKYHQINHFFKRFCMNLVKLGQNLVICFEKMMELGQNVQNLLKIYPWLWNLSQN